VAGFNSSTSSTGQVSSQGANSNMSPTQSASPSNASGQTHFRDLIFLPPSVPQGLVQSLQLQYSPHEQVVDAHGRSLSSAQGSTDGGHGESHSLFSQAGGHGVPSAGQDSSGQRQDVGLSVTELSVAAGVFAGVTLMNSGSMVGSQLLSGHSLSQLSSGHSGSGHPSSHSGSAVGKLQSPAGQSVSGHSSSGHSTSPDPENSGTSGSQESPRQSDSGSASVAIGVTGALGVTVSAGIESGSQVLSVQPPKVVASGTSGPSGEPSVLLSPQPSVGHSIPSMVGMLVGTAGSSGSTVPPSGGHSSGSTTGQSSTQSSSSSSSGPPSSSGVGVPAGPEPSSSLQSPHSGSSQHSSLPTVMLSVGSVGSMTQSSLSHMATVAAGVESSPSPDPQLSSSQSSLFGEQESSVQSAGGGQVESSLQSDVGQSPPLQSDVGQSPPLQSEPADVAGTSVGASVGHAGAVQG